MARIAELSLGFPTLPQIAAHLQSPAGGVTTTTP
jgi:hypothetical protein